MGAQVHNQMHQRKVESSLISDSQKPEIISKPSPGDDIHIHLYYPAPAGDVMYNSKLKVIVKHR